jgi:uncharacterized hydrophobic protein (TIGR00271 family)
MAIAILLPSAADVATHLTVGLELARRMDQALVVLCLEASAEPSGKGNDSTGQGNRQGDEAGDGGNIPENDPAKGHFQVRNSYLELARNTLDSQTAESGFRNINTHVVEVPASAAGIVEWFRNPVGLEEDISIRTLVILLIRGADPEETRLPGFRLFETAQCQTILMAVAPTLIGDLPFERIMVAGKNRHEIHVARQFARGLNPDVIVETYQQSRPESFQTMVIGIAGRPNQTDVSQCKSWNECRRDDGWGVVALVNPADSWFDRTRTALDDRLRLVFSDYQMPRSKRIELSTSLTRGARSSPEFLLFMSVATFLACIGLIQNSAAVIIGAMLVAPLMTPLLGSGMAMLFGNYDLFMQALRSILIGVAISGMIGLLVGGVALILPPWLFSGSGLMLTSEMIARSQPNMLDPFIGLAAGLAGGFAIGRDGQIGTVAGVAIAAALVPPIATAGLELAIVVQACWMDGSLAALTTLIGRDPADSLVAHGLLPKTHPSTVNVQLILAPILLFVLNACATIMGAYFGLRIVGMHRGGRIRHSKKWVGRAFVILLSTIIAFLMLLPFITHTQP